MLQSDLNVITVIHILLLKKLSMLQIRIIMHMIINWLLKILHHSSCISKINNTLIDNAEDLDIVMLMYKCLFY